MRQTAPFCTNISNISRGGMPPDPLAQASCARQNISLFTPNWPWEVWVLSLARKACEKILPVKTLTQGKSKPLVENINSYQSSYWGKSTLAEGQFLRDEEENMNARFTACEQWIWSLLLYAVYGSFISSADF